MTALHMRGVVLPEDEERDLWIVNGRIRTEAVAGAETIVDGGFLVPGLVDAHCHVGIAAENLDAAAEQARTDRDAGALLIRDCGSPMDTSPLQERLELPRLVRAGRHIARPKRYIRDIAEEVGDPTDLPAAVAEQAATGDGWVKLVGDYIDRDLGELAPLWPDDVLAEAMKVAHDAGARVTAHVFGAAALPGLIESGIDCIEHGTGLTDDTIAAMVEHGTALVPTLINIETFPGIAAGASKYPRYAGQMLDLYARVRTTARKVIEAGIAIYAGTDAGGGIAHGRLVDEVIALHEAGMTTEQALGAASWHARGWLGWSGIQESSAADIIAYDEDPRADLNALRTPKRVVLRGRVIR
ncbi:amidohydrolase family protein [Actinophytocola sp.]|uniref:amidohydrolase family protein n=1 Tax=Actinophytocola sp. TaxID=1872138 RepID=UPI003D6C3108